MKKRVLLVVAMAVNAVARAQVEDPMPEGAIELFLAFVLGSLAAVGALIVAAVLAPIAIEVALKGADVARRLIRKV